MAKETTGREQKKLHLAQRIYEGDTRRSNKKAQGSVLTPAGGNTRGNTRNTNQEKKKIKKKTKQEKSR